MATGKFLLHKIFISHSTVDKRFVRRLTQRIEANGFRVWLDEHELIAGDKLSESIADAVANAKVVLVVVSPASVKSKWLRYELNIAAEQMIKGKCRVIPVLMADCAIPAAMNGLLYADFRTSFSNGLKGILTALQHEANRAAKAAGFWAQTRDSMGRIFDGTGWSSGGGDFESFDYDFVIVPAANRPRGEASVVYDIVPDHLKGREPLGPSWWGEYTDVRQKNEEDLFLVVSERPVALPVELTSAPGNCVKYRQFKKWQGVGHVVFADTSTTRSTRGREAILRAARKLLIRLACGEAAPAGA